MFFVCLFRLRVWDKICNISVSCSFIFSNNVLSATNIPTRGVFVERRCDLELKIKTPSEAKRGGARVQWSVIYFVYCNKKKKKTTLWSEAGFLNVCTDSGQQHLVEKKGATSRLRGRRTALFLVAFWIGGPCSPCKEREIFTSKENTCKIF